MRTTSGKAGSETLRRVLLPVLALPEHGQVSHKASNPNGRSAYLMPKKKGEKQKADDSLKVLDVYESWLAKQPVRPVKGKAGFISSVEAEAPS